MSTSGYDHGGELYRATYRFIGTDPHTISLTAGHIYCIIENTTAEWWLVSDDQARVLKKIVIFFVKN